MPVHLLLLLFLFTGPVRGEQLEWSFPLEKGHVARVELYTAQGQLLTRFLGADGVQRSQFGWRPDLDPRPGRVQGRVEELWLLAGDYRVVEHLPSGTRERTFQTVADSPRSILVNLLPGATGVEAWRKSTEGGQDGYAWSPVFPGDLSFLSLGPGHWRALMRGDSRSDAADIGKSTTWIAFSRWRAPSERWTDHSREWMVRSVLVPVTVLLLAVGLVGAWRARRTRGLWLAVLVSAGLGALAIHPLLHDLAHQVLMEGDEFTDPVDSIAQVAATADSLPRLSDVTRRFSFPEGSSWVVTGPSWLGYLVPAVVSWWRGPVVGHNVGLAVGMALLALFSWALARSLGAGRFSALFASGGAVLAPVMLDELDAMSLDRSTLFLVPLFFLCFHRAASQRSWGWPLAAGIALAAVFYGQVHYGIYLAAACPFLVLPRLVGPGVRARLGRMLVVGVVAFLIMLPGLEVLRQGTSDTPYNDATTTLRETTADLLHPVEPQQARDYVRNYDPRQGGLNDPPMATPQDRLLAAVARSLTLRDVVSPSELFTGRALYWLLAALSIGFALAARRGAVAVATADVFVLLLFALGPFLRTGDQVRLVPLPYYLDFLFIPGFEQLKQVYRYVLLAATISSVPVAVGLEGVFRRFREKPPERWRWIELPAVALLLFFAVAVRAAGINFWQWPPRIHYASAGERSLVTTTVWWPHARSLSLPASLEELDPGGALAIPIEEPIDSKVAVHALQVGLSLVNSPPFGLPRKLHLPFWMETNGILNDLAWASGSDRPNRRIHGGDKQRDLQDLHDQGLRYVVLYRDLLPGPELVAPTEAVLDRWFERKGDDGQVAVWALPASEQGR